MRAPARYAAEFLARSPWRAAIGVLVCLVVPLASWGVDDHGRLAFTMYAATVTYRLEIARWEAGGVRRSLDPTEVAADVSSVAAPFLVGAASYRTVAQIDALRAHLRDVASAACRNRYGSIIEVTLQERFESSITHRSERVSCPRSQ
jgi:hypothetical protein